MRKTTRRAFLKKSLIGAAGFAAAPFLSQCTTAGASPKNVLFIAVDDLRPQLNCYGHGQMISPNIDALAASGTRFDRTYCQVPVCGASRASLLTGVRPERNRFVGYSTWVDEDLPGALTLPQHFRNNGYHTISNGKVLHHRTDAIESWSEDPWRPQGEGNWRDYINEQNKVIASQTEGGRGPAFERADAPDDAYFDGKIANKTIEDLHRLAEMDSPFFLATGFLKPHLPFNAPTKYWDMYNFEDLDLADNPFRPVDAPDAALHNWGELRNYTNIPREGDLSEEMVRTLVHGYYACTTYADAQIGRVLQSLDELNLRDNTVIILWGDHGWNLGEHGLWCKHCNFETSLHSPMIIAAPGFESGQSSDALTEFVDIYPTLNELAGLEQPEHLEGTSVVPLMENPRREWKEAVFSRYYAGDSVKNDRYRYTEWKNDQGEVYANMLYDHHKDPAENVNIADHPDNTELVDTFREYLASGWQNFVPQL
jgi:arylsulfatase A-like enzyme